MSSFDDASTSSPITEESPDSWKQKIDYHKSQVDSLQANFLTVKASIEQSLPTAKQELDALRKRVMTAAALLNHLKSNVAPETTNQEETRFSELANAVKAMKGVMDALMKRVVICESEAAIEREKARISDEEIKRKTIQVESMSLKLEEMEKFSVCTNTILTEMRQRVEDLIEETLRQRQRAAENEEELSRVRQEFESLKSYVSCLVNIRESSFSSDKELHTIEKLFERLLERTTQLEGEKMQKEGEVQKLMKENVRLAALLDKKEAQIFALNAQCKAMALGEGNI